MSKKYGKNWKKMAKGRVGVGHSLPIPTELKHCQYTYRHLPTGRSRSDPYFYIKPIGFVSYVIKQSQLRRFRKTNYSYLLAWQVSYSMIQKNDTLFSLAISATWSLYEFRNIKKLKLHICDSTISSHGFSSKSITAFLWT